MNTAELLARVRQSAVLEDTATDWTDTLILNEMNDLLTQLYEASVVKSRQGYWRKEFIFTLTPGLDTYRMPARAIAGAIERLQIRGSSADQWSPIDEVDDTQALNYELAEGQTGQTVRFVLRGDSIVMLPSPDKAYQVRCFYYIRPSQLLPTAGSPALVPIAGRIDAWNATTLAAILAQPFATYTAGSWASVVLPGTYAGDVIGNDGWNDVVVPDVAFNVSASGFLATFLPNFVAGEPRDLSGISGSSRLFIRASNQTVVPALPADFHRSLADATAVRILTIRGMPDKAASLTGIVSGDLDRFGDIIKPRVQTAAKAIVAPNMYRGGRRGLWGVRYP